jgi:UDP-N-acetylmuramate dehydrogenase
LCKRKATKRKRWAKKIEIYENISLKKFNSFKIGGNCRRLVEFKQDDYIAGYISDLYKNGEKFFVLGNGSNILVPDEGYDGTVLHFGQDYSQIKTSRTDKNSLICGSGTKLSAVCQRALEAGLSGLEFAYGIPGSVGGAVFMNAGAYGGQMSDVVVWVETLEREGGDKTYFKDECNFGYRHSVFMEQTQNRDVICSVEIELTPKDPAEIKALMDENLQKRKTKQPLEYPSAGSFFKRPAPVDGVPIYAAALIEECGLKGASVGDAQVSEKHCGFIVNKGNATFKDIMALSEIVKKTVFEQKGFLLEIEPEILK